MVVLDACQGRRIGQVLDVALRHNSLPQLNLRGCRIDVDIARALCRGLEEGKVSKLDLSSSRFVGRSAFILASGLQKDKRLQTLSLLGCQLSDEEMATIVDSLVTESSSLECLSLSCNLSGPKSLRALGRLLEDSKKLQKLDYMQTPLPLDLSLLSSGICKTKTLSRLILSDNELCGIASFAEALTKNQSLKHVRLNNCHLTDEDLFAFSHHLPSMGGLKRLWIGGSRQNCTDAGIGSFAIALRRNLELEELHLPPSGCFPSFQICQQYLDRNWGGRKLLPVLNTASDSLCARILDRVAHANLPCNLHDDKREEQRRRANLVYFWLQNGIVR
jgi:hypothetical protein